MTLLGFRGRNHPQQVGKRGALDAVDDRGTDPEFFAQMEARFGPFNLDAAASPRNAKCARFYTINDDALLLPWHGKVWCNPPYSNLGAWVDKASAEVRRCRATRVVMLLPANRTEQAWWQDRVEPFRDGRDPAGPRVEFLRGRLRFVKPGAESIGPNERPPFGCCLLVWERQPI